VKKDKARLQQYNLSPTRTYCTRSIYCRYARRVVPQVFMLYS